MTTQWVLRVGPRKTRTVWPEIKIQGVTWIVARKIIRLSFVYLPTWIPSFLLYFIPLPYVSTKVICLWITHWRYTIRENPRTLMISLVCSRVLGRQTNPPFHSLSSIPSNVHLFSSLSRFTIFLLSYYTTPWHSSSPRPFWYLYHQTLLHGKLGFRFVSLLGWYPSLLTMYKVLLWNDDFIMKTYETTLHSKQSKTIYSVKFMGQIKILMGPPSDVVPLPTLLIKWYCLIIHQIISTLP